MATGEMKLSDLLPIPDVVDPVVDPDKEEVSRSLTDKPTASHALAMAEHDIKGAAQLPHDGEVKDLGWQDHVKDIPVPLVGKLPNEELWILIRRFNKQMYHVKDYPYTVPGNLDLNIADEEEFSPDKLRANLERLYMTVLIKLLGAGKHLMRLRSWRETRRTSAFCAAYSIAWIFDLIFPLLLLTAIVLITVPKSREIMFPPAPLALVSVTSGGVQKPKAGVLGSTDSATGAPENHKGEAVEAEANAFVNSVANVALSSVAGKHPQGDAAEGEGSPGGPNESIPDPTAMASTAGNARTTAKEGKKHDKAKEPMETAIWNKMRPTMHALADISDTWERFGNALSPTPPFPHDLYRLRLAGVIVPLLAGSFFVSSYMIVKGAGFGVGFGFFGDPIISRGLDFLNTKFPRWQKLLELRNTLLKGVPTNAQLTVTLLRIGEANKAPIPPPPISGEKPSDEPMDLTEDHLKAAGADWPLNATDEEIKAAMAKDPTVPSQTDSADVHSGKHKSHGKVGTKIMGLFKTSVKGGIDTALGADHVKAKVAGNEHSKQRLGVVRRSKENRLSGPVDFKCRYDGKKGHAYIATKATIPCIGFSLDKDITNDDGVLIDQLAPVWSVAVADIKEMKKLGGLGWKSKLVVGWALDREVADGLEIIDKLGNSYVITAMILRDELFNRLVAMGGQKWEAW